MIIVKKTGHIELIRFEYLVLFFFLQHHFMFQLEKILQFKNYARKKLMMSQFNFSYISQCNFLDLSKYLENNLYRSLDFDFFPP